MSLLDTLQTSKRLQAERITEILSSLDVACAAKDDLEELDARMEQRFDQVDERFEQMDERLPGRIELSEERTEKQVFQLQSDLYRVLLIRFGALLALIIILNYVTG